MVTRTETPQLDLLPVLDLLRIAIAPLQRHLRVRISVDEDVERTIAVQHRQERHRRRDLPEDGLDLVLDLLLGLFGRRWDVAFSTRSTVSVRLETQKSGGGGVDRLRCRVLLVERLLRRLAFGCFAEDVDLRCEVSSWDRYR